MGSDNKFNFYIETEDGVRVEWRNLTRRQAQSMHAWTENNSVGVSASLKRYGWEMNDE
jgi:hypothetical protein